MTPLEIALSVACVLLVGLCLLLAYVLGMVHEELIQSETRMAKAEHAAKNLDTLITRTDARHAGANGPHGTNRNG